MSILNRKPEAETIVVALVSHMYGNPAGVISEGARFRASHPAVAACPTFFAPDGLPDEELHLRRMALRFGAPVPAVPEEPVPSAVRAVPPERLVRCVKAFSRPLADGGISVYRVGDLYSRDDVGVKGFPANFEKPKGAG